MTETVRRFLAFALPSAAVATIGCLLLAVTIQQQLRQGADDPQNQLVEDAAAALNAGASPASVVGSGRVDLATSLSPFVAVYDQNGRLLAADGELDGAGPQPPIGVLDTARSQDIDRVTWQPRPGVRMALVAIPWSGGTVLAGRSLNRVEEEVDAIGRLIALGWLGAVGAVAFASLLSAVLWPRAEAPIDTSRGPN